MVAPKPDRDTHTWQISRAGYSRTGGCYDEMSDSSERTSTCAKQVSYHCFLRLSTKAACKMSKPVVVVYGASSFTSRGCSSTLIRTPMGTSSSSLAGRNKQRLDAANDKLKTKHKVVVVALDDEAGGEESCRLSDCHHQHGRYVFRRWTSSLLTRSAGPYAAECRSSGFSLCTRGKALRRPDWRVRLAIRDHHP